MHHKHICRLDGKIRLFYFYVRVVKNTNTPIIIIIDLQQSFPVNIEAFKRCVFAKYAPIIQASDTPKDRLYFDVSCGTLELVLCAFFGIN